MKCVIATTGGGGHLFPAIRVAEELRRKSHEVLFVGTLSSAAEHLKRRNFPYRHIEGSGLRKNPVLALRSLMQYFSGTMLAKDILRDFRADVVIGFGGFGSVSVILAAAGAKIPVLIHEQNVVPGKANRFLARFAQKIALSFSGSEKYFRRKAVSVSGYPCLLEKKAYDRESLLGKYGLQENRRTLFVFGGSQGSQNINRVFAETVAQINEKVPLQFIHLSGEADYPILKGRYAALNVPFVLLPFSTEMGEFYFLADGVLARSGAGTITEIAMFEKLSILIPYPHAGAHQKENALVLEGCGLATIIEEKDLNVQTLADGIMKILREGKVSPVSACANKVYRPDAAFKIVSLAEEIVR